MPRHPSDQHPITAGLGRLFPALLAAGIAASTCGRAEAAEPSRARSSASLEDLLPRISREGGYVSSAECVACHKDEHASWHRSYHRTMTQVASPDNVAGRFDGTTLVSDGLPYRVWREGDEFWAEMPDPDVMMYIVQGGRKLPFDKVPRVRQRVVLATGSHHYQTYWVASPRYERLLQTLPLVYLLEDRRWVPRETAFMRDPADHGRFITQWNHHCIRCHSTGGNPGLNEKTGLLETRVAEFGVACEACHGPGEQHVAHQRRKETGADLGLELDPIVNPKKLDHRRSSETCGQCHGVFVMRDEFAMKSAHEGALFKPGDDLHQTRYYIQYPKPGAAPDRAEDLRRNPDFFRERWWEDGTILAGGREYTALSASGCYLRGEISCLSCHSMHRSDPNDQLKRFPSDNTQCTQCHQEPKYTDQLAAHTFHPPGSTGSNCLNCHMPHTTYALFKGIRSHQISSPRLEASARHGVPNACNLCHLDQTLAWTRQHLRERYGTPPPPLAEEQEKVSAALLWLLKGHAAQRAIAAWHTGWKPAQETSGTDWLAPFTAQLLDDPYGVVRYIAARSLRTLPRFEAFDYDFLAPPDDLTQRKETVVAHWQSAWSTLSSEDDTRRANRILLDPQDGFMRQAAAELLRQRDNRPVVIKE